MKIGVSIISFFLACALFADVSSQLSAAREALRDGLWDVAIGIASKCALSATSDSERITAHLVELEALSRSNRAKEMLKRLQQWNHQNDERIRYWHAWAHFECGNADMARHLLATKFTLPEYELLSLRLSARAAAAKGDKASAESLFVRATESLSGDARLENVCDHASARESFGDVSGAIGLLSSQTEALASFTPAAAKLRLLTGQLTRRAGDSVMAQQIFEALASGGTNVEEKVFVSCACELSEIYVSLSRTNDALRVASEAYSRSKSSESIRRSGFALGFLKLYDPSTRDEGHKLISSIVRKYPSSEESGRAQSALADLLLSFGDAENAIREYEVLRQSFPEYALDSHVFEGRGHGYMRMGRFAESAGMFARAAQTTTNDVVRDRCIFARAEAVLADKNYDEAARIFSCVSNATLISRARLRGAEAVRLAGRADDAAAAFRELAKDGGDIAVDALLCVASLESSRGRLEQSIEDYTAVLSHANDINPSQEKIVSAYSGRGRALYRAYRFREAESDFASVARLDGARKNEMEFLSLLCKYGDGRDREAYKAAKSLLITMPDSPLRSDLQFWIARYDADRGDRAKAIVGFEECAANPSASKLRRMEALVRAARCAMAMSDFPLVVSIASRIVLTDKPGEIKSNDENNLTAEALVLQSEALKEMARFDEAVFVCERASRMNASEALNNRAEVLRADCLFAMGADDSRCYVRSLDSYRKLMRNERLSPSEKLELSFKSARTLEKMRRIDDAVEEYYTNVVLAYWTGVTNKSEDGMPSVIFNGSARAFFQRAVINLANHYESRGELEQSAKMLDYLVKTRMPAAEEAQRRINRMKEKGGF